MKIKKKKKKPYHLRSQLHLAWWKLGIAEIPSKLDSNGPPHTHRPAALLKHEPAAFPADFGHFFQGSKCTKCFPHLPTPVEPLRSVRGGAAGLLEKLSICLTLLGVSSTALRCSCPSFVHREPVQSGFRAAGAVAVYLCMCPQAGRAQGQARLTSLRHSSASLTGGALYNRSP